jgi:hypothetical protein
MPEFKIGGLVMTKGLPERRNHQGFIVKNGLTGKLEGLNMTKELNRMSQSNYFKLCTYVSGMKLTNESTFEKLASIAADVLGFPVTRANIRAAFETLEITLPGKPKTTEEKVMILAKYMESLYAQLGMVIPKELKDIF